VRQVLLTLGGWWRVAALGLSLVPLGLRDRVYDGIASLRKRVFGTTKEACPLMTRELATRFDA
jgi:predicted DCC family thiol-disulfide oxidoreductase YuxK